MQKNFVSEILIENTQIPSVHLGRNVIVDIYYPRHSGGVDLLLINDGQDLSKFKFGKMLDEMMATGEIKPLICVGIHCGKNRKMEYGVAGIPDYKGRGALAARHQDFVFTELLPFVYSSFGKSRIREKSYAGFSLGGLTALDTVWTHPDEFKKAGVFSGSFWWRSKGLQQGYNEATDRIMHKRIREGQFSPGLKFYFTTGSLDETMDRNHNGIIDSIDDTLGLIEELEKKGYKNNIDIRYINYEDGRHDVATWGLAMPAFLRWGWGQ